MAASNIKVTYTAWWCGMKRTENKTEWSRILLISQKMMDDLLKHHYSMQDVIDTHFKSLEGRNISFQKLRNIEARRKLKENNIAYRGVLLC